MTAAKSRLQRYHVTNILEFAVNYILFVVIRTIIEMYLVTKFATCTVIVQVDDVMFDY